MVTHYINFGLQPVLRIKFTGEPLESITNELREDYDEIHEIRRLPPGVLYEDVVNKVTEIANKHNLNERHAFLCLRKLRNGVDLRVVLLAYRVAGLEDDKPVVYAVLGAYAVPYRGEAAVKAMISSGSQASLAKWMHTLDRKEVTVEVR